MWNGLDCGTNSCLAGTTPPSIGITASGITLYSHCCFWLDHLSGGGTRDLYYQQASIPDPNLTYVAAISNPTLCTFASDQIDVGSVTFYENSDCTGTTHVRPVRYAASVRIQSATPPHVIVGVSGTAQEDNGTWTNIGVFFTAGVSTLLYLEGPDKDCRYLPSGSLSNDRTSGECALYAAVPTGAGYGGTATIYWL